MSLGWMLRILPAPPVRGPQSTDNEGESGRAVKKLHPMREGGAFPQAPISHAAPLLVPSVLPVFRASESLCSA
jgi:hypothetical protein